MNKKAIYFLNPFHGNIGDSLQTYCIYKILSKFFEVENILKFDMEETSKGLQQVSENDIIFMSSGGNLGDLHLSGEVNRRRIIQECPNNTIVSFPQTIHFNLKKEAEKSSYIYGLHPNLYIFARDPKSYLIAKEVFPSNSVQQLPDPVFTLSHAKDFERKGILCIFRNDSESNLKDKRHQIIEYCKQMDPIVDIVDTVIPVPVLEEKLFDFLDMVSKYKSIVTDRFHGTIFAAITGTPCLAFPTINHKVTGGIYWHKRFGNKVIICESISDFIKQIQIIPKPYIYNPSEAIGLYYQVLSAIEISNFIPDLNPVEKTIISRRTVRKWREAVMPENILLDIIKAGVYAPSGANAQCVRFRFIQDKQEVSSIYRECFGRDSDFPSVVIMVGYDFGVEKTINFNHGNPIWEPLKYQDIAAAIQNMQLYCESIGLSCCWLSFFTDRRQKWLDSINIKNNNIEYLSGLAIGFAKTFEDKYGSHSIVRKDIEYYIIS